ncbi:bolA family protein [Tieghemostelium lacteum]|uniref:BolA family protein n=1 Tax=Tieghemostelium lacteum TaxID=361077 RepID=A0A152A304_TIELA|nr:bolA family protein [Tieghemostelium lacteum]|eukprot:KYR00590.1 bolA family protein [Tieghemostelium lacteum]
MTSSGPIEQDITSILQREFQPIYLDVKNESYMHNVPKGSESHFKVYIVSEKFNGIMMIEQHRLVNTVLHAYLSSGKIHALSITSKTPTQWEKIKGDQQSLNSKSPPCIGGFGK